jgi:hypothetical protein
MQTICSAFARVFRHRPRKFTAVAFNRLGKAFRGSDVPPAFQKLIRAARRRAFFPFRVAKVVLRSSFTQFLICDFFFVTLTFLLTSLNAHPIDEY